MKKAVVVLFCAVCLALCLPNIGWGSSKNQIKSETNLSVNDHAQVNNNNEAQCTAVQATGDQCKFAVTSKGLRLANTISREQVKTCTFINNVNIPDGAVSWDASLKSDNSVKGWAVENGNMYDVYYGCAGEYPRSSSYMNKVFFEWSSLEKVVGLQNVDMSLATKCNDCFAGCKNLKEVDLSAFKAFAPTQADGMF